MLLQFKFVLQAPYIDYKFTELSLRNYHKYLLEQVTTWSIDFVRRRCRIR